MPSLKIPQAGQKIAYNYFKELSDSYEVYLIAFRNTFEKEYSNLEELNFCKEVHIIDQTFLSKIFHIFLHPFLPFRVASRMNQSVVDLINHDLSLIQFDKIHFEFTSAMQYVNLFDSKKVILEATAHDITFQSYHRKYQQSFGLKKLFYLLEYARFKRWEIKTLKKMSKIIVLNNKDLHILNKEKISPNNIEIKLPKIDLKFYKINQNRREKESLIFWGAMNRKENDDAILWFLDAVFPLVKNECSNIKIYIVGISPSELVLNYHNGKDIIVTGFVEDPTEYFEKATLAIAPLRLGAGIKIKVLESLAAGLKVISTDVGAEGIYDDNIIIANSATEFMNKILENL